MHFIRSLTAVGVGFVLAAVLFSGLPSAVSDDHDEDRLSLGAPSQADLVRRVRRAVTPIGSAPDFQLIVVATEEGSYVEAIGSAEGDEAIALSHRLHALADWAEAGAEVECGDCEDENSDEDDDSSDWDDESSDDDSEDDDSEDDDYAVGGFEEDGFEVEAPGR